MNHTDACGGAIDHPGGPLGHVSWPVRTARLTLSRATPGDVAATWEFRRRPDVSRWLTRAPASRVEYEPRFLDPASLDKTVIIRLAEASGTPVVGDLMVKVKDAWAQAEVADRAAGTEAELGWVLHPDYIGHGYATEAVRRVLELCFVDLGVRRITAGCFTANEASWRLMERVGMHRETHARAESLHRDGEWLDTYVYAMLREEWTAART